MPPSLPIAINLHIPDQKGPSQHPHHHCLSSPPPATRDVPSTTHSLKTPAAWLCPCSITAPAQSQLCSKPNWLGLIHSHTHQQHQQRTPHMAACGHHSLSAFRAGGVVVRGGVLAAHHTSTHGRGVVRVAFTRSISLNVVAMAQPWRPDMNDVDRLSKGGAAKRRGTGSFNIPHRLNSDERPVYEAAKKKGFLQVRGTGYRKGRKGHPLPNIWRQWCDAKAMPCIIIEQDATGSSTDVVVVDLAPLRSSTLSWAVEASLDLAQSAGARRIEAAERPLHAVPFDTIPVDLPLTVQQLLAGTAEGDQQQQQAPEPPPSPEAIAAAEGQVAQQADAVRELKALGLGNAHPEVQSQVQVLIKLKADLQQLLDKAAAAEHTSSASASSSSSDSDSTSEAASDGEEQQQPSESSVRRTLASDHPFATVAVWQLPVVPLFFEASRPAAKQLAKDLTEALKV